MLTSLLTNPNDERGELLMNEISIQENKNLSQTKTGLGEKYLLTVEEAARYFGIGQKKLRQLASENSGHDLFLYNGVKLMIKRKQFESFIDTTSAI